jgi:predicted DsbA family dithiol-disulfide isomerase
MQKQQIEIFTGNSPLCDETVKLVREVAGSNCDIKVCNLQQEPERVRQYGLKSVPAIAIDGILAIVGKPSRSQLESIGSHLDRAQPQIYLGMGI